MKNIKFVVPEGPEQMSDLVLSEEIIRVRNQINSIAPRLPDNGARFKANLKLMEDDEQQNRRNQNQNINSDELLSKINEGPPPPPPELVILPPRRRTNEHQHQQQSSSYIEQMTDLGLSEAIIRVRSQLKCIDPCRLPDSGARFKAHLKLMEDEQSRRNSIPVQNQNQKHRKACGTLEALELQTCSNVTNFFLPPPVMKNIKFEPEGPEQMSDLGLSEAIIRVRNQINSIAPKLPDKGARFKANLKLMEDEQQNRRNQNQKHRKAKRSRTNGCPELDTVACGTLEASQSHDLSSKDENDVDIEVPQSTSPSTSRHSTSFEDSQEIDQINESLKVLAESLIARLEERKIRFEERKIRFEERRKRKLEVRNRKLEERNRKLEDKQKHTIGECMKIMNEMEPKIADDAYIRVLKVLQEKGWRVTFMFMSDKLRREWISSI